MRNCNNCHNGHFNYNKKEEMFCDITGYMEEDVTPEFCCESHRYMPGYEEEKNDLLYDGSKEESDFYIVTKHKNEIVRYLKIYLIHKEGYPNYAIRSYNPQTKISLDHTFEVLYEKNMKQKKNKEYEMRLQFKSHFFMI